MRDGGYFVGVGAWVVGVVVKLTLKPEHCVVDIYRVDMQTDFFATSRYLIP